ncbi:oxygen-independent coproporphyrinogen III oxidase, partial [Alteromonas sp.]|nr:oxygen-independent coproporphyrinogen III oxidase [Alteromonas sp.]
KCAVERKFNVNFDEYFAEPLEALSSLENDGMVDTKREWIRVPAHARIFIRAICARFDAYLTTEHSVNRYSSSI